MSTDHFAEAERLLDNTQRELEGMTSNTVNEVLAVAGVSAAMAQAHATLALVGSSTEVSRAVRDGAMDGTKATTR